MQFIETSIVIFKARRLNVSLRVICTVRIKKTILPSMNLVLQNLKKGHDSQLRIGSNSLVQIRNMYKCV